MTASLLDVHSLGAFLEAEASADRFSGAVVIEVGGVVEFAGAYGHAHLGLGVLNNVDTRFNTASITKMFTAIALLQLVEQGLLSLDTTLRDVLPDVRIGEAGRITVDHLLAHRSGLGDYWTERCKARRSALRTTRDYVELINGQEPAFAPGSSTAYGNSGYVLLGRIIEVVSGLDYYDYVRRNVTRPAGMARADHLHLDSVEDFAHGYTYVEWEGEAHPDYRTDNIFQYPVRGSAATGLYSSAPELIEFGLALRANKLLHENSTHLLLPAGRGGYGYGTQEVPYSRGLAWGHGGRAFGAATFLLFLPELAASVCVLSNYDRPADKRVFAEIDRTFSSDPA